MSSGAIRGNELTDVYTRVATGGREGWRGPGTCRYAETTTLKWFKRQASAAPTSLLLSLIATRETSLSQRHFIWKIEKSKRKALVTGKQKEQHALHKPYEQDRHER